MDPNPLFDPSLIHRKKQMAAKLRILFKDRGGEDDKINEDSAIEFFEACINVADLPRLDEVINEQIKLYSQEGRLDMEQTHDFVLKAAWLIA